MNVILKLKLKFELKSLFFWAATASLTCRLWRTEERAHRSAIKLQFSGHHFEIISHRILIILKHGFLQKCLHTIGNRKHCDADLDNCLRVASLGRLGAMLGKLPSLETRSKVRIHQGAAGIAGVAAVGGHRSSCTSTTGRLAFHIWRIFFRGVSSPNSKRSRLCSKRASSKCLLSSCLFRNNLPSGLSIVTSHLVESGIISASQFQQLKLSLSSLTSTSTLVSSWLLEGVNTRGAGGGISFTPGEL